jgi:hypothetical protein
VRVTPVRRCVTWLSGIGVALTPGPLRAQVSTPVVVVAGCYQLTIAAGSEPAIPSPGVFRLDVGRPVDWLPMLRRINASSTIQAPGQPAFDTATAFGSWRHALPDRWMRSSKSLWGTAWRVTVGDTLEVKWSDGFTAVDLKLRMSGDTLRGGIHTGSDQTGRDRTGLAKAWRVICPTNLASPAGRV